MSAVQELRTALLASGIDPAEIEVLITRLGDSLSHHMPPRRLHEKDLSGPCYVYCLVNPWNKRPFYIGISSNPWARFDSHLHDAASAAWPVLRILVKQEGVERDRILKIYKECADRNAALALEHSLITTTPKLVNRDQRRYRMWNP